MPRPWLAGGATLAVIGCSKPDLRPSYGVGGALT